MRYLEKTTADYAMQNDNSICSYSKLPIKRTHHEAATSIRRTANHGAECFTFKYIHTHIY